MEHEQKLKLIDFMRNFPFVWQPTHAGYCNKARRNAAYKKVASMLGEQGLPCV